MDGERVRDYWKAEVDAMIRTYEQFERLIPANGRDGSYHAGEDGRFVEDLIRVYLRRFLPTGIEVLTGFILRPAVKTGKDGRERKNEKDRHSSQLDILVVDTANYPVFQRFGDSVIVPPEGVLAIISVKKHLRDSDVEAECEKLLEAANLCRTLRAEANPGQMRGPFLGLVSFRSKIDKVQTPSMQWVFDKMTAAYAARSGTIFDELIGFVGALDSWSIFKRRPTNDAKAGKYVSFTHKDDEQHLGLQLILTGILSVFYDETRSGLRRPGFTAFQPARPHDKTLGEIPCPGA